MKLVLNHERVVFSRANLAQVVLVHVVAIGGAPFLFSWAAFNLTGISTFLFLYSLGIGHHMLLTHRSFRCAPWLERLASLLATLTWRGPFAGPVRYVAIHRVHHAYSDTALDPHSPVSGVWHALMSWFWNMPYGLSHPDQYDRYAQDLARDPWHRFLDRHVHELQLAWAIFCFVLGVLWPCFWGGAPSVLNGVSFVVYGVFLKTLECFYIGNIVDWINHAKHPIGYRNFETGDLSTNSGLLAFIHGGGAVSWHNNHHAKPNYFTVRKRGWEFDAHYWVLRGLEKLGLVWDIRVFDESRSEAPSSPSA